IRCSGDQGAPGRAEGRDAVLRRHRRLRRFGVCGVRRRRRGRAVRDRHPRHPRVGGRITIRRVSPAPAATSTGRTTRAVRATLRYVAWLIVTVSIVELGFQVAAAALQAALWRDLTKRAQANGGDRVTILALGESSTFGIWVDGAMTYPAQLERKLR